MNVLAIDTSNNVLGVAIIKNQKIIGETITDVPVNHSVRLMPVITSFMAEVKMSVEEIGLIVVANGPGSYTGVRVGVTTAKTLAWGLNIPVVAVSSLEVLAYSGRFFNGLICPFYDARRQTVFTGLYQWKNNEAVPVNEEQNILMEDLLSKLKVKAEPVLFLSPDIEIYEALIKEYLGDLAIIPEPVYHVPRPGHLATIGMKKEHAEMHSLTPNYLRMAEAEVNWLKEQGAKKNG